MSRLTKGGLVGVALALTSCSLGPEPQLCEANEACRDAFGLGWQCGDSGYCEAAQANARCASSWPTDLFERPERYTDAIVMGSLFDHRTDVGEVRSAELAVRQVNDLDGLEGRPIAMIHCDYQYDLAIDEQTQDEAARSAARWLADVYGVSVVVGPATSDQALAVYDEVSPDNVLIISPSATSPELTHIDGEISNDANPGLFWRTVPPDDLQGSAIAMDLLDRGVTEIAILYQAGAYGNALADVIEQRFSSEQHTVHRLQFANDAGLVDALTDAVYLDDVQEIVFLSGEVGDVVSFLDAIPLYERFFRPPPTAEEEETERSPPAQRIFLADAAADPMVYDAVPEALSHLIRGTRPEVPGGPVYDTFASGYAAAYDGDDPRQSVFTAFTYDAAWLALYGMAWSWKQERTLHGPGIGRGLRRVSGPASGILPVRPSSWPIVLETFGQALRVDVEGASGSLDFDSATGETSLPYEVWVVGEAGFEAVAVCTAGGCEPL